MKFTLAWLKEHLETDASLAAIADAMTMAGLEVEHVVDPAAALAPFSVARIVSAVQHPNADRLRVCQVDTADGPKEIVCGAPNACAGLTTIYAPIGAYVPGLGVTLSEKPVRGVASKGMLCSARELELSEDGEGILDLPANLAVGTPAAAVFPSDAVIDFEVTPNRPDWLGVAGIARELAAAGLGRLKTPGVRAVEGRFACPLAVSVDGSDACPVFAGRLIRGVRNGASPAWLQARLRAIGLRSISALVDVTNYVSYDRARPLHVYDAAHIVGGAVEARLGRATPHGGEHVIALDGKTYLATEAMCVIADAGGERPIGLGGVMGGSSTACSDATTEVFVESAWFDPIRTAQTGRALGIASDAQYRFARGVDPGFVHGGLEQATAMILELCGGEASDVVVAGAPPAPPAPLVFDPDQVERLTGLRIDRFEVVQILQALSFTVEGPALLKVTPPSWRRDMDGAADLVEEVARIAGYDRLPSTPLPPAPPAPGGVLTPLQARVRTARRALAAMGYQETIGWSFTSRANAERFGGGDARLVLSNPISAELDCMRPSALPGLLEACARNAARGLANGALFEIGPVFAGDQPGDQRTAVTAVRLPASERRWDGVREDGLFALKSDLMALLDDLGAPAALQVTQGPGGGWWHPGRSARVTLGLKATVAAFGQLHPKVVDASGAPGPVYAFELWPAALPSPQRAGSRAAGKTRGALSLPPLMALRRDFAFVVGREVAADSVRRAALGTDRALIVDAWVFDAYEGPGVPGGSKSIGVEITVQPQGRSMTDVEIEDLSARVVAAVAKATGARLRS